MLLPVRAGEALLVEASQSGFCKSTLFPPVNRLLQASLKVHLRCKSQELAGACNVGQAVPDIAGPWLTIFGNSIRLARELFELGQP